MTGYGIRRLVRAVLGVLTAFLLVFCTGAEYAQAAGQNTAELTILQTGDLHGMIWAYDYTEDTETNYGLTKAATVIQNERARDPDLLLVDTGDFIMGNFQPAFWDEEEIPIIEAMNLLDYDVLLAGGQELDAGNEVVEKIRTQTEAAFLIPGGETGSEEESLSSAKTGYQIVEVKGIRAAMFGWDLTSSPETEEMDSFLDRLNSEADVTIGLVHVGEGQTGAGWGEYASQYADQIDVLFLGHVPEDFAIPEDYEIPLVTAGEKGSAVGKCVLTLEKKNGEWEVTGTAVSKMSAADAAPDEELLAAMEEVHRESLARSDAMLARTGREEASEEAVVSGEESDGYYIVKAGDTLSEIGLRYGCTVEDLVKWNGIEDADRILIGSRLNITGT